MKARVYAMPESSWESGPFYWYVAVPLACEQWPGFKFTRHHSWAAAMVHLEKSLRKMHLATGGIQPA